MSKLDKIKIVYELSRKGETDIDRLMELTRYYSDYEGYNWPLDPSELLELRDLTKWFLDEVSLTLSKAGM